MVSIISWVFVAALSAASARRVAHDLNLNTDLTGEESGLGLELEFDWVVDDTQAAKEVSQYQTWLATAGKSEIAQSFPLVTLERDQAAPEIVTGPVDGTSATTVASLLKTVAAVLLTSEKSYEAEAGGNANAPLVAVLKRMLPTVLPAVEGYSAEQMQLALPSDFVEADWKDVKVAYYQSEPNLQTSFEMGCDKIADPLFTTFFKRMSHWGIYGQTLAKKILKQFSGTKTIDQQRGAFFVISLWSRLMKKLWEEGEFNGIGLGAETSGDSVRASYKNEFQLMPRTDVFGILTAGGDQLSEEQLEQVKALAPTKEMVEKAYDDLLGHSKSAALKFRIASKGREASATRKQWFVEATESWVEDLSQLTKTRTEVWDKMNAWRHEHNFGSLPPRCQGARCWCVFEGRGSQYDIISEKIMNAGLFNPLADELPPDSAFEGVAGEIVQLLNIVKPEEI